MEERRIYTEKDFPIQSRIWYVWIPIALLGLLVEFFSPKNSLSFFDFAGIIAVVAIIGIIFWKRKGFLINGKGIRVNPRFFGGTTGLILYGDIERVYMRQKFLDSRLGIAATCIELKLSEPNQLQGILREIYPVNKEKYTVCISGLLPSDAQSIQGIIQERASNPTEEDIILHEKSVVAGIDGVNWYYVLFLTGLAPLILQSYIPYLKFSSNGKNILFFIVPPLLTFLSYKYWRIFFPHEQKSPQRAYLVVYSVALLWVVFVFYIA